MNLAAKKEFWAGVRAELPLLLGVFPFGVIYGVVALDAGIPSITAQAMSSVVFAGSAQFVTTQLVKTFAPGLIIVFTIAIVNLRHALYSASIAPHLKHLSPFWKGLLAYLLTDEAYLVSITQYNNNHEKTEKHWFFLGAGLALWICWQVSTAVGILLGTVVPPEWNLDFALALTFIALVIPVLKDKAAIMAALTAGLISALTFDFPFKLGIITAAIAGIVAGMALEGRR